MAYWKVFGMQKYAEATKCSSCEGTSLTCAHQNDSLAPTFMYTYLHVRTQPFRVYLFRGHWGGHGNKETGCRYQHVHKQPFRVYLFRGHGGDLGLGRTWGQGDRV